MASFRSKYNNDKYIYKHSLQNSYNEITSRPNFYDISYVSTEDIKCFKDEKRIDERQYLSRVLSKENSDNSDIRININARFADRNCRVDKVDFNTANQSKYECCTSVINRINSESNNLDSYDKVYEENYFTIRMPMYYGLFTYQDRENVKCWFGYYRDLKLVLAENLMKIF